METIQHYVDAFVAAKDPRLAYYPLTSSIWSTLFICAAYILFVITSKTWMAKREPFNVRKILVTYNIAMVLLSIWLVYEMLHVIITDNYSLGCQPVDYSDTPQAHRMVRVAYAFYFTKVIELTDTVFFILRKKFHLVTFLHVFHHASMPPSVWLGIAVAPGGFGTFYAMLNSLIHVFMYTYYGLAAAGPAYQKYIWWKAYMTHAQMVQFVLLMLHAGQLFFIPCDYPFTIVVAIFTYALIFLVLFSNYYYQTYFGRKRGPRDNSVSNGKIATEHSNGHHQTNGSVNGHSNGHLTNGNDSGATKRQRSKPQ